MLRRDLTILMLLALAACGDNFVPREKVAVYNPATGETTMPYPCTDWSQTQTHNYLNQPHSNYGCAVNTNAALQLEDPRDLHRGHGTAGPDTGVTTRVVERYRAGEIPEPLAPLQTNNSE